MVFINPFLTACINLIDPLLQLSYSVVNGKGQEGIYGLVIAKVSRWKCFKDLNFAFKSKNQQHCVCVRVYQLKVP